MASTFFGFSIARRGMSAHQAALSVTAHNIANASTAGFSRQQAVFHATTPSGAATGNRAAGAGQVGTGVHIAEIRRVRDGFLDFQLRQQLSKQTAWQERHEALSTVEMILMEPSETGLSNVFDRFWGAWQELAKNPTSGAVRAAVVETASTLASSLNSLAAQSEVLLSDLNVKAEIAVVDINSLSSQLAVLNEQIVTNLGAGLNPNDLLDRRDILLDELSKIVDFRALEQPNGAINVAVGGRHLVQESRAIALTSGLVNGEMVATWPDGQRLAFSDGKLAGIAAARTFIATDFLGRLNTLASELHESVNRAHANGRSLDSANPLLGANFFELPATATGQEARHIRVDRDIVANHNLLRAAGPAPAGLSDGSNALAIARLRNALMPSGTASLEGYFAGIVTDLGVETQQAERIMLNQESLMSQLQNRREEAAGVSIDEELAYMVQFQHGYQASARLLATLDEILQTIINLGRQ
ncbi:MAG: flagellar hook-associated protein FlgK [Firmicutes bacterium]|nr:flagellar hook-associated protein FlgK [Dethiobacter sp.]MBS3888625.1 flagellar hook-associated protein FlgK [Bacillota bacterium]MBS4054974.1 flagellar hook-associated protein FlgK [Thermaerobacter sp.]